MGQRVAARETQHDPAQDKEEAQAQATEPADDARRRSWRRHSVSPFAAVRLTLLQLRRSWLGLLAVGVGLLATVTLICVVPLYNNLVANVQLQRTFATSASSDTNIEVTAHTRSISSS
ncbi:MAG: hypothetical protein ABI274_00050, partial [Ktedonobacterales bacterium]